MRNCIELLIFAKCFIDLQLIQFYLISGNINFNLWNAERAAHDTQKEFVFFEIVKPPELEFTYKIVPAIGFGAPFVS